MNCPEPRDRAEGDFETTGPVDAELRRVGVHPRFEMGDADARVTFVAGQPVSLDQGLEVLMAIQLPDDLLVAGDLDVEIVELGPVQQRAAVAADGVDLPVDAIAAGQVSVAGR